MFTGLEASCTRTVKRNCLHTNCPDEVEETEAHTNAVCEAADGWTCWAGIKCLESHFDPVSKLRGDPNLLLRFLMSAQERMRTTVMQAISIY